MNHVTQPLRYTRTAMMLHWVIAALILIDFSFAISFSHFDEGDLLYFPFAYGMHMSVGMAIMVLSVLCVIWRLMHKYPPLPQGMGATSRALAKTAHLLLYGFILVVPFTGWAVLSVRKRPAVLLGSVDWPNISFLAGMTRDQRAALHDFFLPTHIALSYVAISLVGVHVLAALYHHFYLHDDVLRRMLPGMKMQSTSPSGLERAE